MKVAFVRPDLRHLDGVTDEAVVLPIFADERPLRGIAGLVDWRLNGALSRWIAAGRFQAEEGDALLYPDRGRLSFERVILFGLGTTSAFGDAAYRDIALRMLRALRDLGLRRFASPLPGRRALGTNPRQLVDAWLSTVQTVFRAEPDIPVEPEVLVLEDTETQRSTADTVQGFLRRLRH